MELIISVLCFMVVYRYIQRSSVLVEQDGANACGVALGLPVILIVFALGLSCLVVFISNL